MNTTLFIAFLAGLISFLSPCVLPLIPGYICYISGSSLEKLIEKKNNLVFIKTVFFSLGFSLVFISFGLTASFLGNFLLDNSDILSKFNIIPKGFPVEIYMHFFKKIYFFTSSAIAFSPVNTENVCLLNILEFKEQKFSPP